MAADNNLEARIIRLEERDTLQEKQLDKIFEGVERIETFLDKFPCTTNGFRLTRLEASTDDLLLRLKLVERYQDRLAGKLTVIASFAAIIASIVSSVIVQFLFSKF